MNVPSRCHGFPGPKARPPGAWLTDNLAPERQPHPWGRRRPGGRGRSRNRVEKEHTQWHPGDVKTHLSELKG